MLVTIAIMQVGLLLCAAWHDVATRLIPNRICFALAVIGSVGQAFAGPTALLWSVGMASGVLLTLFAAWRYGVMGGGDVKLLVALTLGLSPLHMLTMFVVTALAGGVLAMLHLMMRRLPPPQIRHSASLLRRIATVERWRILRHGSLPYGVAIACGGIWINLGV